MAHDRPPAPPPTVRVIERRVSADVHCPDVSSDALLRRTVVAHRRERRGHRKWLVFGTQLSRLVDALEGAGYEVQRSDATSSPASETRSP